MIIINRLKLIFITLCLIFVVVIYSSIAADNSLSKIIDSISGKNSDASPMFSADELDKINEASEAYKNNQPLTAATKVSESGQDKIIVVEDSAKSYVYLRSILYSSPSDWSVWINDQKITPTNNSPSQELYIKSIRENEATISWSMSISKWKILANKRSEENAPINKNNQVEFIFTLSFNQTYMLNGGRVVEGKIVPTSSEVTNPTSN